MIPVSYTINRVQVSENQSFKVNTLLLIFIIFIH